ncbi:hypothetical protein F5051DRAFT_425284 [Lentinula edodes]|nr:hypothetical protein F5051DRAFT_425284 [Lentinula edodes]
MPRTIAETSHGMIALFIDVGADGFRNSLFTVEKEKNLSDRFSFGRDVMNYNLLSIFFRPGPNILPPSIDKFNQTFHAGVIFCRVRRLQGDSKGIRRRFRSPPAGETVRAKYCIRKWCNRPTIVLQGLAKVLTNFLVHDHWVLAHILPGRYIPWDPEFLNFFSGKSCIITITQYSKAPAMLVGPKEVAVSTRNYIHNNNQSDSIFMLLVTVYPKDLVSG